ncbi:hypothetical protein ACIRL3_39740 [Streptomyces sp. NPDC102384]|uniref:hypothetical protein n=1 Tax=Streptomyces sp. NPDC102384 TaxID=3366166 RepID=UPI0038146537
MAASTENTAAHKLHAILSTVRESGGQTYAAGWAKALDAPWDSVEFSRRHSEVINLLFLTMQQINALPDHISSRTERHITGWWTAVMQPKANWQDTARPPGNIIDQDRLDHLASTADLLATHLGGTSAAPHGGDLANLEEQCREWLNILESLEDNEISSSLRVQLISQIQHLIWLIEHEAMFGGARVTQEASAVIGELAQATQTVTTNPENSGRWRNGFLALLTACTIFTQAAPVVQASIEAGTGLYNQIENTIENIGGE